MTNETPLITEIIHRIEQKKDDTQQAMWNARKHGNFKDADLYAEWRATYAHALLIINEVLTEHLTGKQPERTV